MIAAYLIALTSAALGQTTSVTHADTFTAGQYPARVAAADGGGIYVTDPTTDQVIQLNAAGATVGTFSIPETPVGIAHHNGNIYVSRADGVVGIYDAAFVLQGTLDSTPLTMVAPNDIAVHPLTGEVYVVDAGAHMLYVFSGTTGLLVRSWGTEGSGLAEFMSPQSLAIDAVLDHVIVTDTDNFRVQVFNTAGILQFKFGYRILFTLGSEVAWFARVEGVAVDSCSNIYLTDAVMGTVRAFDAMGVELDPDHAPVISYGTLPGELRVPCDVMINTADRMYVASYNNASVEVYDLACTPAPAPATASANRAEAKRERLTGPAAKAKHVDNPYDIIAAMADGEAPRALDINNDHRVDLLDLEEAVKQFGGATLEQFLLGMNANVATPGSYEPPHMIDIDNLCGRCHSLDGMPEGMLTAVGQENLCLSCHQGGGIAKNTAQPGTGRNNSHPWGVPATSGGVAGPDPASFADLDLHLDGGNIRCGTCHNPHESTDGAPLLRATAETGALCMECHRGAGAPTIHAVGTEHGPEVCSDCHDMHATGDKPTLVKEMMYSWYNAGMVAVGFADDTIAVGAGGFVDPAAGAYGFCDVCHEYFDDSVNPPVPSAEFLALTIPHDESMDLCTNCHAHENGFMPGLSPSALAALGSTGKWAGADVCNVCHAATHTDWMTTRHEGAWDTLNGIFQGANAMCLGCHTVGFGDPDADGFIDDATTPQFEGVQCENCHGEGAAHAQDVLHVYPPLHPKDSAVCGGCHTDSHHPTYDEWATSGHAVSSENAHSSSCNACHAPLGTDPATGHGYSVECAACHNPHVATGNDAVPEVDHDKQLRWPEVVPWPAPSNFVDDATDPARFGLCGQCHHSRGRTWDSNSRGPHHSLQSNVLLGEMPMPAGEEATPLVPNTASDHAVLGLQCIQCHMYQAPHEDGPPEVDAITGHSWSVNFEACAPCHTDAANAEALAEGVQAAVHARLENIKAAMGDPSTWEYSCCGGPPTGSPGQDDIDVEVRQCRFIIKYIEGDASYGVHNGAYTSAMLDTCETLLGIGSGDAVFLGAEACGACHGAVHTEWEGTLHAEALQTLANIGNGTNPACLGCHTVAFGEPNGYVDQATTPHLANVQCENCHGTGAFHVLNPTEPTTQPFPSLAAELCGGCHTDSHHPTYDEWATTGHAASYNNSHSSSCDACHAPLRADPHVDAHAELGVECVVCHDPHAQTGNATNSTPPADYQLRFPQAAPGTTVPSNFVADAMDPTRFGLCGQCHHSRGRTWDSNSRGPHHSLQANVLLGEMPMPAGQEGDPLVDNAVLHAHFSAGCERCHMETFPHENGPPEVDAVTGHEWVVTTGGCNSTPECHASSLLAEIALTNLQGSVTGEMTLLDARLGDPLYWEYSCCGGPPGGTPGQDEVPVEVQKVRFLKKYIEGDGSTGAHNPAYVLAIFAEANALLDSYIGGGGTWPPATAWWPGACCDAVAACTDGTQADCLAAGGTWYSAEDCTTDTDGDGTPDFVCPAP